MRVPPGGIILWSGAIIDIPPGFVFCDGDNDTPDLRNLFVVGAGDTYAVDASGGATTHTHDFTSDGHSHTILTDDAIPFGSGFTDTTNSKTDSGTTNPGNSLPPYYALAYIMKT